MNKTEFLKIPEADRFRTLDGIAYWAHIQSPDMHTTKRFNAPLAYHITLGLDEENAEKARSYGLTVKEPTEYVPYPHVKIKRNVKDTNNPSASKPDVVDSMQRSVPTDILVGNGSKVRVKFATFWYDFGKGGVGAALLKVQVLDLVKYEGGDSSVDPDLSTDSSGWTLDSSASSTPESTTSDVDADLFSAATI